MNEIIKVGLTLMIVTTIAGVALAVTNYYTEPLIEAQMATATDTSLNKVISADSFKDEGMYYGAFDRNGNLVGRVLKVEVSGYSSIITALAGINLQNEITGVDIVSQQETPGLGANVAKEGFLKQFVGKSAVRLKKDGGDIDSITGATISSRALTDGIRIMMEKFTIGVQNGSGIK
jgi:electron transport complex protein RnfG